MLPVLFDKLFDKTNVFHYPTTMDIRTDYKPEIPHGSPINRVSMQSGNDHYLGIAETDMFGRSAVSLTTSITLGDALLATACNIKSFDQLRVAIRYLIRYIRIGDPGLVIVEEALEVMKEEIMDYINRQGGAETIIEKALDHHFGEPGPPGGEVKFGIKPHKYNMPEGEWYPVNNAHEDMDELEKIKHIDTLLDLVKKYNLGLMT